MKRFLKPNDDNKKLSFLSLICLVYVSLFPIGFSKIAPGTLGSLLALVTFPFLTLFSPKISVAPNSLFFTTILLFIISFFSVFLCSYAEKNIFKKKDPSAIVIDEYLGQSFALLPVAPLPISFEKVFLFIGIFLTFRYLDITKPFFIKSVEKLPSGFGIMADDLLIGIIIATILFSLKIFLNLNF